MSVIIGFEDCFGLEIRAKRRKKQKLVASLAFFSVGNKHSLQLPHHRVLKGRDCCQFTTHKSDRKTIYILENTHNNTYGAISLGKRARILDKTCKK